MNGMFDDLLILFINVVFGSPALSTSICGGVVYIYVGHLHSMSIGFKNMISEPITYLDKLPI